MEVAASAVVSAQTRLCSDAVLHQLLTSACVPSSAVFVLACMDSDVACNPKRHVKRALLYTYHQGEY